MEFIFIRHGETEYNKHHQLMGSKINAPLDDEGRAQAQALLTQLPPKISVIYSSPLRRAAETAQVIGEHYNMAVQYSDLLKERDFGSLSGKSWEQIDAEAHLPLSKADANLKYDYQPYGGESVAQVKARLVAFIDQIKHSQPAETVVVVTHYGIIRLMDSIYQNKDTQELGNSSVHRYSV